ncbi:MAG: phytoene desaturase family protein [Candidatus Omnitrophica bacterium]|nr:phytoene desaturase family protein [Candidatus Omnitrophota bacterium]
MGLKKKIAVIGAGVGGLSVAARLAGRGCEVEVFERMPIPGGRASIIEEKGFKFDTGPSFVLMPDFFEEVFRYCRADIRDYLDLRALDIGYKIFYPDAETLTMYKDPERTKVELERIEPGAAAGYDGFVKKTAEIYEAVRPLLYRCFTPRGLLDPRQWALVGRIHALRTYWDIACRYFKSEKLRYAFTFEAMFIGVSPFKAPAFYSIISYTDQVQKIYHPMGGMYRIPLALEELGRERGVTYHYRSEIEKVTKPNGRFILHCGKKTTDADNVVINADYVYAQNTLLHRDISPFYRYSCSVYLLYLGLKRKLPQFEHHNVFFSGELKKNLRQIFDERVMPDDPSFYVHVPTRTDPSLAPEGKEILYLLIPVPNLLREQGLSVDYEATLRKSVFTALNRKMGIELEELIEVERHFYPVDFISRYNIKYAATFGLAHTLFQSAFFRPANFDRSMRGLYYVGASTQPGGGLPVVIAGSRIVADMITRYS